MASLINKLLRAGEGRILAKLRNHVVAVNALEEDFKALTDEQLAGETAALRERFAAGETLDDLLPEAFAAVREAASRTLGMRHFDVQIMGGAALHLGNIAEMRTGEGKTLVATLPAYLNAIAGRGVHVVTVNDFLASYQSELMGRVFRALGMTTGCIISNQDPQERREQRPMDAGRAVVDLDAVRKAIEDDKHPFGPRERVAACLRLVVLPREPGVLALPNLVQCLVQVLEDVKLVI
ncbi:MAG: hypothetical protein RL545_60, partial [Actinomycetota bacterium]